MVAQDEVRPQGEGLMCGQALAKYIFEKWKSAKEKMAKENEANQIALIFANSRRAIKVFESLSTY